MRPRSRPSLLIQVEFESLRPRVIVDAATESDAQRLKTWLALDDGAALFAIADVAHALMDVLVDGLGEEPW